MNAEFLRKLLIRFPMFPTSNVTIFNDKNHFILSIVFQICERSFVFFDIFVRRETFCVSKAEKGMSKKFYAVVILN